MSHEADDLDAIPLTDENEDATSALSDSHAEASAVTDAAADARKQALVILCPYCGHTQSREHDNRCGLCGGLFEPLSRRATQIAMGPWMIRDKANPFRPGFSYEVLKRMIASGRVMPTTVLRGPTTRQFWSIARNVPGVAHLLGFCHKCGKHVELDVKQCPHCAALFKSVKTRNELGLLFPHRKAAEAAQRSLNRLLGIAPAAEGESAKAAPGATEVQGVDQMEDKHETAYAGEVDGAGPGSASGRASGRADGSVFDPDDAMSDLLDDVLGPGIPGGPGGHEGGLPPSVPAGHKVEPLDFGPSGGDDGDAGAASASTVPTRMKKTSKPSRSRDTSSQTEAPGPLAPPNPAALPPRTGVSPLVWVLIALNVLVAGAVAWFVMTQTQG